MLFHEERYRFLSNFYPAPVRFEGLVYPTVENAYQASKIIPKHRNFFQQLTPGQAKREWKQYPLVDDWNNNKMKIMFKLLVQKFKNPVLRQKLIDIHEEIIEDNYWHDNFWGNCLCDKCQNKPGENVLGRLLTVIREMILLKLI